MYKNKKILALIIILFLISVSLPNHFTASGISVEQNDFCASCGIGKSYIIRLKDEPLSLFSNRLQDTYGTLSDGRIKSLVVSKLKDYKNTLSNNHNFLKNKIFEFLGLDSNSENLIKNEFYNVLNGIVIKDVPYEVVDKIKSLSIVESVHPTSIVKANLDDSIPLINADDVQVLHDKKGYNLTGKGVTVALVDSGIDYTHPDLVDNVLVNPGEDLNHNGAFELLDINGVDDDGNGLVDDVIGWSFNRCALYVNTTTNPTCAKTCDPSFDVSDGVNHGTRCAGIIAAVAPDVQIYPLKVLNHQGIGSSEWIIEALDRAKDPNNDGDLSDSVDIVSLSLGSLDPCNYPYSDDEIDLIDAVNNAVNSGVAVVVAAGNQGGSEPSTITSPGCARDVITVGATTKNDLVASFSSIGPAITESGPITKPDLVAPGVSIRTTSAGGGYSFSQGTSFAAPHVSGSVALLLQAHPCWNPDDIKQALKQNAVNLVDLSNVSYDENTQGSGRLDVLASVNLSSAPPIAKLYVSGRLEKGSIAINGTAKNGTGNPEDFVNYSIYYRKYDVGDSWTKLYTNETEVDNDIMTYFDTNDMDDAIYEIKLLVKSKDQASFDISKIWFGDINIINIEAPDFVYEKSNFSVILSDENSDAVKAFIILIVPYHVPQIKYGSSVDFKSPTIISPLKQKITGRLLIVKFIKFQLIQKEIDIINN